MEETKKNYEELQKKYDDVKANYVSNYFTLKDKYKKDQEELRDQFKIDMLMVEKPLKAEKYRLKVEKKKRNRALNEPPRRGLLEEIGNSVTHGVGALIGILALVLMIIKSDSGFKLASAIIYGTCFFFQMFFSCMYHSFRSGSTVKRIFRRFDYSSIYLQIGGTFAPFYLIYMVNNMWGLTAGLIFFIVQWVLIITGITFVGVFGPGRLRWLHFTLYFVIGWSGLIFLPFWFKEGNSLLFWILGGGIVYTLGMIPFAALKGKPVAHFIWHFVVLIGAILMWVGIYLNIF